VRRYRYRWSGKSARPISDLASSGLASSGHTPRSNLSCQVRLAWSPVLLDLPAALFPLSPTTDEEELRWHFRDSPEATRPCSNFEAMCFLRLGLRPLPEPSPEDRVADATRDARIEQALVAAGPEVRRVLWACLGAEVDPQLEVYGLLGGLLVELPATSAAYRASGTAEDLTSWLSRLPRRAREAPRTRVLLGKLVGVGTSQFIAALMGYRDAKRRLGQARS
jgi:hypothetical protein